MRAVRMQRVKTIELPRYDRTAAALCAIAAFLSVGHACCLADEPSLLCEFQVRQKFRLDDRPVFATPDFDDSAWPTVDIPGGWMGQGFPRKPYVGWYRIHAPAVQVPDGRQAAVILGRIGLSCEIFVNGQRIGRIGGIDPYHMWSPFVQPRVIPIPHGLLKAGQPNLIAVRVQRLISGGGLLSGPIGIGDAERWLEYDRSQSRAELVAEAIFIVFYGGSFLYALFLFSVGLHEPKHIWFGVLLLQIAVCHALESRVVEELWGATYASSVVHTILSQLLPLSTMLFFIYSLDVKVGWRAISLYSIYVAVCACWWYNADTKDLLYFVWLLLAMLMLGPVGFVHGIQARRRGHVDAEPLLVGLASLIGITASVTVLGMLLGLNGDRLNRLLLVPASWYGWLSLHLCMIYVLAAGFQRTRRNLRRANQRLLSAQEDEQKRVARELHDGVGQAMLAVKLQVDGLAQHLTHAEVDVPGNIDLQVLRRAVGNVIDELHQVAVDLRPDLLDRLGIVEATRQLARSVYESSGVEIRVSGETCVPPEFPVSHLYRIIQEAINNIAKHSDATQGAVVFSRLGNKLHTSISDDGTGFDQTRNGREHLGLGLTSMKERAELMGGRLEILSSPETGTTVEVEVPLS